MTVRSTAAFLSLAAALAWSAGARAQTDSWPAKPVRIVSAMTPGGLSDVLARIVAQHLEGKLNAAAIEAMTSPAVARQLEAEAIEVLRLSPEDFTAFVQAEIDRWGPIARRIGKTQ